METSFMRLKLFFQEWNSLVVARPLLYLKTWNFASPSCWSSILRIVSFVLFASIDKKYRYRNKNCKKGTATIQALQYFFSVTFEYGSNFILVPFGYYRELEEVFWYWEISWDRLRSMYVRGLCIVCYLYSFLKLTGLVRRKFCILHFCSW